MNWVDLSFSLHLFVQNVKIVQKKVLKSIMSDEFYSTSEARKVLSDLVNQVKYSGKTFEIGRYGKVEAKLVPIESVVDESGMVMNEKQSSCEGREMKPDEKPDFHEHIQNQRAMRNKSVKYDSRALKYEYAKLAKKYDLKLMVLFGSHANGNVRPDSDVDIAVVPRKELTPKQEQAIYSDLVDLFGRDDVDVVNLKRTRDVLIRYEIFIVAKVLFESEPNLFSKIRMRSWFEYQDFKHYFDRIDQAILNRLEVLTSS